MPLGGRNKAENGYVKYVLQHFHSRQLHIGQTGSRLRSVVLPKATIWSPSCLRLCWDFICVLTGFCVEVLLDWWSRENATSFHQPDSKRLNLLRGPTGQSLNACRVNGVSVQIPSYSHFLFKWPLIQLERHPSRPATSTFTSLQLLLLALQRSDLHTQTEIRWKSTLLWSRYNPSYPLKGGWGRNFVQRDEKGSGSA